MVACAYLHWLQHLVHSSSLLTCVLAFHFFFIFFFYFRQAGVASCQSFNILYVVMQEQVLTTDLSCKAGL